MEKPLNHLQDHSGALSLERDNHSVFSSIGAHSGSHVIDNYFFWMESLDDFLFHGFSIFFISSVCDSKGNGRKISSSFLDDIKHPLLELSFTPYFFKNLYFSTLNSFKQHLNIEDFCKRSLKFTKSAAFHN